MKILHSFDWVGYLVSPNASNIIDGMHVKVDEHYKETQHIPTPAQFLLIFLKNGDYKNKININRPF